MNFHRLKDTGKPRLLQPRRNGKRVPSGSGVSICTSGARHQLIWAHGTSPLAKARVRTADSDLFLLLQLERLVGAIRGRRHDEHGGLLEAEADPVVARSVQDRKSTRLNSSHLGIS